MTPREQIEQLGKELLTLAGLQADVEQRVIGSKKKLEKLQKELEDTLDSMYNEHY